MAGGRTLCCRRVRSSPFPIQASLCHPAPRVPSSRWFPSCRERVRLSSWLAEDLDRLFNQGERFSCNFF